MPAAQTSIHLPNKLESPLGVNSMGKKEIKLVVGDAGWADTLPEWLLEAIEHERVVLGIARTADAGVPQVGNAEVCAYLYTASLRAPMSAEHSNIYFWIGASVMEQHNPGKELPEIMADAVARGLTEGEFRELKELRAMIFRKRGGAVKHPIIDALEIMKAEFLKKEQDPQLTLGL